LPLRTERIISGQILQWPPFVRYSLAIAAAFAAILLRLSLDPIWGAKLPFITLFPAIMLSAWLGGLGPGLLTTAITAIAAQYYWIEPAGTFAVADKSELLGQFVFIAVASSSARSTKAGGAARRSSRSPNNASPSRCPASAMA
jgi:K+-sensing histidine kinase KdpD